MLRAGLFTNFNRALFAAAASIIVSGPATALFLFASASNASAASPEHLAKRINLCFELLGQPENQRDTMIAEAGFHKASDPYEAIKELFYSAASKSNDIEARETAAREVADHEFADVVSGKRRVFENAEKELLQTGHLEIKHRETEGLSEKRPFCSIRGKGWVTGPEAQEALEISDLQLIDLDEPHSEELVTYASSQVNVPLHLQGLYGLGFVYLASDRLETSGAYTSAAWRLSVFYTLIQ